MITVRRKVLPFITRKVIWYDAKPKVLNCLSTLYKQSNHTGNVFGFERKDFYTKLIDLSQSEEAISNGFDKDLQYKIRRAGKDGTTTGVETDLNKFIDFYNVFALTKNLPAVGKSLYSYGKNLLVTKAVNEDETIVMHSYLLDNETKRVRSLHSASLYRHEHHQAAKRSMMGRANTLLHFADMQYFKQNGYLLYDIGGYAFRTKDAELQGINKYKDGFGGELVKESDYWPKTVIMLRKMLGAKDIG